jgi:hypothetical protein
LGGGEAQPRHKHLNVGGREVLRLGLERGRVPAPALGARRFVCGPTMRTVLSVEIRLSLECHYLATKPKELGNTNLFHIRLPGWQCLSTARTGTQTVLGLAEGRLLYTSKSPRCSSHRGQLQFSL